MVHDGESMLTETRTANGRKVKISVTAHAMTFNVAGHVFTLNLGELEQLANAQYLLLLREMERENVGPESRQGMARLEEIGGTDSEVHSGCSSEEKEG